MDDEASLAAIVMDRLDAQDGRIEEQARQLADVRVMAGRLLVAAGILGRAASDVTDSF